MCSESVKCTTRMQSPAQRERPAGRQAWSCCHRCRRMPPCFATAEQKPREVARVTWTTRMAQTQALPSSPRGQPRTKRVGCLASVLSLRHRILTCEKSMGMVSSTVQMRRLRLEAQVVGELARDHHTSARARARTLPGRTKPRD